MHYIYVEKSIIYFDFVKILFNFIFIVGPYYRGVSLIYWVSIIYAGYMGAKMFIGSLWLVVGLLSLYKYLNGCD